MSAPVTVLVCVNCTNAGEPREPRDERAGARLHRALTAANDGAVTIQPVECLSVCKRPVTVGFVGPGRWTYVYGEFQPGEAAEILAAAGQFAAAPDGIIPWKERPEALKKGVVARIPPLASS